MPRNPNQKCKLLYLMKTMLELTDENHPLTLSDILIELRKLDIIAERKSIYDDLEALRHYGIDIEKTGGRSCGYYVANRTFELPELKLLVDAVQSSKFITAKKSNELIHKVESLASIHEARALQRQVYVANRVKTMNESIYYNIDKIHTAISQGKKIRYRYFSWTVDFSGTERIKREYRHGGKEYLISPWALTWDDENYYMVGFDSEADRIKHYRVDKMVSIDITDESRDGQAHFEKFDMAVYARQMFGMFGGEEEQVKIRFKNHLIGVVIDRFGKDVFIMKEDEEHFAVTAKVAVSPQFLSWVFGFGSEAKILSPARVAEAYCKQAQEVLQQY